MVEHAVLWISTLQVVQLVGLLLVGWLVGLIIISRR